MDNEDLDILGEIDELLKTTDLKNVSASSTGFEELPFGYYKCHVKETKVSRTKSSQKPMITLKLEVIEDGYELDETNPLEVKLGKITGVAKRLVFKNYVIADSKGLKNFVSDMKKFEDPISRTQLLPDEVWQNSSIMIQVLKELEDSVYTIWVYVHETKKADGSKGSWTDIVSNSVAVGLGLPD